MQLKADVVNQFLFHLYLCALNVTNEVKRGSAMCNALLGSFSRRIIVLAKPLHSLLNCWRYEKSNLKNELYISGGTQTHNTAQYTSGLPLSYQGS